MDFSQLKGHLCAWYEEGDPRDFAVFYTHYLGPRAMARARSCRLRDDEVDDFSQEAAKDFADREKRVGADADGFGLWSTHVGILMMRFLRKRKRWRDRHVLLQPSDVSGTESVDPRVGLDPVDRLRVLDSVRGGYDTLPDLQQQAVVAFTWPVFAEQAERGALDRMASAASRTKDEVVDILWCARPFDCASSVAALFSDAELQANRSRCLDAYRKRRDHGLAKLAVSWVGREFL